MLFWKEHSEKLVAKATLMTRTSHIHKKSQTQEPVAEGADSKSPAVQGSPPGADEGANHSLYGYLFAQLL